MLRKSLPGDQVIQTASPLAGEEDILMNRHKKKDLRLSPRGGQRHGGETEQPGKPWECRQGRPTTGNHRLSGRAPSPCAGHDLRQPLANHPKKRHGNFSASGAGTKSEQKSGLQRVRHAIYRLIGAIRSNWLGGCSLYEHSKGGELSPVGARTPVFGKHTMKNEESAGWQKGN